MSEPRKILVIDDEKVVCNSFRRVLEEEGFEVSVATDGREGLEKLAKGNFDAVLVDVRMPGVGGMDVLRITRRKRPRTRAIVMTAYSSVASAVEAMQLGADDFLPKPFTPRELTERVNRLFQPTVTPFEPHLQKARFSREKEAAVAEELPEGVLSEARILLAGSDSEEMAVLRKCLSTERWQVKTAERHDEIVGMIQAGEVDVLITGMDVLGMKAYDLIPEVKRLGSNIPIIVACADSSLELARKIREFGIFFYLMEPFDPEEVREAVRDAVRKAMVLRGQVKAAPVRSALIRSIRTIGKNGMKVGFVALGELMEENGELYQAAMAELKRRGVPVHTELADKPVGAKDFPRYFEQDQRVVILVPTEGRAGAKKIPCYSAAEFEKLAAKEPRGRLKEVAYPEVLHWLNAQGVSPEVKVVCLHGKHLGPTQLSEAASLIVAEGLS